MRAWLKIFIAILVALLVGLTGGFVFYLRGRREAERATYLADQQSVRCSEQLARVRAEVKQKADSQERRLYVALARVQLYEALRQLQDNNYGLAGQHLGLATQQLRRAQGTMAEGEAEKVDKLLSDTPDIHALIMRLDAMARLRVEKLLGALERLSGAK